MYLTSANLQLLQVIWYAKMSTQAMFIELLDEYFISEGEAVRSDLLKLLRSVNVVEKYQAMNYKAINGLNAVHYAAVRGDAEMLKCLLSSLPDAQLHELLMTRCTKNWTAIHYAATFGYTDAIRVMIDRPELTQQRKLLYLKDDSDNTALDMAIGLGHAETAELIYQISPVDNHIFRYLIAVVLVGGVIFLFVFSKLYKDATKESK